MGYTKGNWKAGISELATAQHLAVMTEFQSDYKAEFPSFGVSAGTMMRGCFTFVADCGCHARSEANAVLIAAAPKLLAACGSAVWLLNNRHNKDDAQWEQLAQAAEEDLRAAIAKARGDRDTGCTGNL